MKRALALAGLASLFVGGPALADPGQWTVELGAAARVRPTHLGSDHYISDAVPIIEVSYDDRVFISFDDGARWEVARWGPVDAGPIVEYRQSFDEKLPRGAHTMEDAIEVGAFTQVHTPIGVADVRLRKAVNSYDGWSGDLAFNTGGQVRPKLLVGAQFRVGWADSNFTTEYFGLTPHTGSPRAPRFNTHDFVTAGAELDAARDLTPSTRLILAISEDRILGNDRMRRAFSHKDIATSSVGVTYHWSARTLGLPHESD